MVDFAAARRMMIDTQVRTADVTDPRLLAAMMEVARERFVPVDKVPLAYLDLDLPVTRPGQTPVRRMLKPMVLAKLLQAAEITRTDRVLDVGCAGGYSSAVLAELAAWVVAVEQDPELAAQARATLTDMGVSNVDVTSGQLNTGAPAAGPYDVIVVEGATEFVPTALFDQLKNGGRFVCVLGSGPAGRAMLYRLIDGNLSGRPVFDASAPLLPGFNKPPAFVF